MGILLIRSLFERNRIDHKSLSSWNFQQKLLSKTVSNDSYAYCSSASLLKNIYNVAKFTKIITNTDALYIDQNTFFTLLNKTYEKLPHKGSLKK